jgi:hypothetical protein
MRRFKLSLGNRCSIRLSYGTFCDFSDLELF